MKGLRFVSSTHQFGLQLILVLLALAETWDFFDQRDSNSLLVRTLYPTDAWSRRGGVGWVGGVPQPTALPNPNSVRSCLITVVNRNSWKYCRSKLGYPLTARAENSRSKMGIEDEIKEKVRSHRTGRTLRAPDCRCFSQWDRHLPVSAVQKSDSGGTC